MAKRIVFNDEDNNELDCYINTKGKAVIKVGQVGEDIAYSGFISLAKDDVKELIEILTQLEKQLED